MAALKWVEARKTVCIDWNGVLDTYKGFTGDLYPPAKGAKEFLKALKDHGFIVVVLTSVDHSIANNWFKKTGLREYVDEIVNKKVPAIVYLDDRGITFNGNFEDALNAILSFKAWWEDDDHIETPIRSGKHATTICKYEERIDGVDG